MKITTKRLKQLIREAIEGMDSEQYPKVRELIGPDLLAKALAMMKDLENRMNTDHGMMGGGAPYPKDSKLFLKALEAVLGDANSGGLREGYTDPAFHHLGGGEDAISAFFADNQPDNDDAFLVYELDIFAKMVGMSEGEVDGAIDAASDPDVPYAMSVRDVEGEPHVFIKSRHNV